VHFSFRCWHQKISHRPTAAVTVGCSLEFSRQQQHSKLPLSSTSGTPICFVHDMLIQETQLSLTNRATHFCKFNGVADLVTKPPPHIGYHTEFGRSALKHEGINTGTTPKLGSAGTPLSWDGRGR